MLNIARLYGLDNKYRLLIRQLDNDKYVIEFWDLSQPHLENKMRWFEVDKIDMLAFTERLFEEIKGRRYRIEHVQKAHRELFEKADRLGEVLSKVLEEPNNGLSIYNQNLLANQLAHLNGFLEGQKDKWGHLCINKREEHNASQNS